MIALYVRVHRLLGDQVFLGRGIGCPQKGADRNWGQFLFCSRFFGGGGSIFHFVFLLSLSFWGGGRVFLLPPEPPLCLQVRLTNVLPGFVWTEGGQFHRDLSLRRGVLSL